METLLQDVRYALRALRRTPGFAAVAVVTLALGIGANVAIFSLIYAALLRPLPFPEPERLATLSFVAPRLDGTGMDTMPFWSYPKFETLRAADHPFEELAGYATFDLNLTAGDPERLAVEVVSGGYFPLLGVRALEGRTFAPEEDATPRTHPVILLSHGLWQRRFGGDPGVMGRRIEINGVPLAVVGVLPEGFRGLTGTAEAWVPMMTAPLLTYDEQLEERWSHWHRVVGRLEPGASLERAGARLPALARAIAEAHPRPSRPTEVWDVAAAPLEAARLDAGLRTSVLVLFGAVGFVLLIGCVNVAGLLLARAAARRREVAIRLAVGAGRGRLVRQLLTESIVLALAGGAAGLLLGLWGTDALTAIAPAVAGEGRISPLVELRGLGLDLPVLGFTLAVSVGTGVLFGLIPALQATHPSITGALHGGDGALPGLRASRRDVRGVLVAAEVALALMLLIGAGLMLRSFATLRGVPIGFEPDGVLAFQLDPAGSQVDMAGAPAFYAELLRRIAALPGVEAAAVNRCPPLSGRCMGSFVTRLDATVFTPDAEGPFVGVHAVSADYFRTLRIPLLRGRAFDERDRRGAPLVAIVNETAARTLWPGQDPIGRRIGVGMHPWRDGATAEVVGVAGDARYGAADAPIGPDVYVSMLQGGRPSNTVMVRAAGDPRALVGPVRREVLALKPDLPIFDIATLEERVGEALAPARFGALLLALFAAVALALAAVGIYGTIAYAVAQRTREIGIRMALGAARRDVLALMVGRMLLPAAAGLLLGLGGAAALTRVLSSLLYGVGATDPATFAAVAALLAAVALLASWIPARRAARVDPMVALRNE